MTDKDVAKFFNISVRTLTRRLDKPLEGEIDLNLAEPRKIGGRRFWLREMVEKVAGIKH
jgi:hypothetical protein